MRDPVSDVHPDHVFRTKDGKTIKNLSELASELAAMDEEVFQHHVTDDKNDFSAWVLHIVRDEPLARVFSEIKDRRLMLLAVQKRLQQLETPNKSTSRQSQFHFTARDYVLGIVIGAVAMLMMSRLL